MGKIGQFINRIADNKKSHFGIFFVVLICMTFFMMSSYYPLCPGQDFHFHFRRLNALIEALTNGTFPYYIDYGAVGGYGYLTKVFYSDFVLIPFAIVGTFTNAVFAYQLTIFTVTILCGIFTYKTINTVYKNTFAASTGAILYTFSIYRLLDIYHRAALGEAISFTFVPLVFLGLYHIIKGDYKKWYILTIAFSLMIFTHVISTVLMFITVVIILIIYYKPLLKERRRLLYLIVSGLASLIIVAYYLYPMIEQMASGDFYYNSRQMMSLAQDSKLGLHWIIWGLFSGVIHPAQVFVPGTGILLTCVIVLRIFVQGKSTQLRSADIGVAIGLFYILASSVLFPWSVFPFNKLSFIQLPWRLYEFSSFFFAVSGAYYLSQIVKSNKRALAAASMIIIATLFVIASDGRLYKEVRCYRDIIEEATIENDYQLGGFEYVPAKVFSIEYVYQRGDKVIVNKEKTIIKNYKRDKNIISFDIDTPRSVDILELPLFYYKGYKATFNNTEIEVTESNNGLAEIEINQSGRVEVQYKGTIIQQVSFYISIISILALIGYIVNIKRKKK